MSYFKRRMKKAAVQNCIVLCLTAFTTRSNCFINPFSKTAKKNSHGPNVHSYEVMDEP